MKYRLFLLTLLLLLTFVVFGQVDSFRKINAQTKASITQFKIDRSGNVYFLTDKIYLLDKDQWRKIDFPVDGKIYTFFPLSPDNIWFTINTGTNTSLLYHFHDSVTENIHPPFCTYISAIHFITDETALLASFVEVASFNRGAFSHLPSIPSTYVVEEFYARNPNSFFALTNKGELFQYNNGIYNHILNNKQVKAFCFTDIDHGYVLTAEGLYRKSSTGFILLCQNEAFGKVTGITELDDGSILMVGHNGLILLYSAGQVSKQVSGCEENLTGITKSTSGEIWIWGERGTILYSGKRIFPQYHEIHDGFSSMKLIIYGINTDDEYGVAMDDLTGEGKKDIYSVRIYEQNRLYVNNLTSQTQFKTESGFNEEALKRKATGAISPEKNNNENELKLGVCTADIDNDSDQDIYLCYLNSHNKLLLNNGKGFFRNVSIQNNRACENLDRSNMAAFSDVDLDGDLDLFVTSEEESNRLFENDGTGHFTDITPHSGLTSVAGGMCTTFTDINGDGYSDLAVTFWNHVNKVFLNTTRNGKIHFRDITSSTDLINAGPGKSNGITFADINNDGFPDLFIASRNSGNKFYLNDGKGFFRDKTNEYFPPGNFISNGVVFADFDLDGFQDLYLTNVGENVLYRNVRGEYFEDVTAAFGAELTGYCTGCAAGDIDNDGDPDLYVANYINGDSRLFLNNCEKRSYIKFRLHGVYSNRDAIGTKIWLYTTGPSNTGQLLAGYQELTCGNGYGSSSAKEVIFGVKPNTSYWAVIKFPSSKDTLRVLHLTSGTVADIDETDGYKAKLILTEAAVIRFFKNGENQPEIMKFLLVILLLVSYNLAFQKGSRKIKIFRTASLVLIFTVFSVINNFLLYQWFSLPFFIAPASAIVLLVLLHLYIELILQRRISRKEKEELREKISRDLHDDLASTLGSLSIYSGTLAELDDSKSAEAFRLSQKISSLAEHAVQSVSDIIWMTSPRNDSLQGLISKISNSMMELLSEKNISYSSSVNIPEAPFILNDNTRNDLFLILKEGIHNITKHAEAKNVFLTVESASDHYKVILKDDGKGFDINTISLKHGVGNGLANMRKRAEESKLDLEIISEENRGTTIILQFQK